MAKELLIRRTSSEVQAALVSGGRVVDLLIDRREDGKGHSPGVGDIYMGRVLRVLPGMQSAFLDIGAEKAAFLHTSDAFIPDQSGRKPAAAKGGRPAGTRGGEEIPDEMATLSEQIDLYAQQGTPIEDILKAGDDVLVQVSKEPIADKGCRVTRHVALAGRYAILMPLIDHVGVSRRIGGEAERRRLREILLKIRPSGQGVIARTVAEGKKLKTLRQDLDALSKLWADVRKAKRPKGSRLVHRDLTFTQRVVRDVADEDVGRILLDSKEEKRELDRFIARSLPPLRGRTSLHAGSPLFEKHGVDKEIERALANRVPLRSGGSLNIEQTEALVSIDVNTGKFVGKKSHDETVLKTNLEAVQEIAHQIRLRNCGGIIIIDLIDMRKESHRKKVYAALLDVLKKDRAKTNILPISSLGLVEMTRKRTRDTLARTMLEPCPHCAGLGRVKSVPTVCHEIARALDKAARKPPSGKTIGVRAHPKVAARLRSDRGLMDRLKSAHGMSLQVRNGNGLPMERYEILPKV